ncbi:MAG TPA: tripartite tricarboxylate transporter substrate binding protein [Burkholderiales bacterium]|nr:tripartite tricarboxylate transporter substrate binding protein [Burkholderiales bacterium]
MFKNKYLQFIIGAALVPLAAHAQTDTFPTKPIRVIVPFAPGGSVDLISRVISPKMGELLGQQIIVDNRAGASGNIGSEMVARATPDGHTLLMNTLPFVVNPHIFSRVPYHPINDFAPVGIVSSSPSLVTVHPSVPVSGIKDLLALARARPGQINYASAGIGTNPHIAGELFNYLGKTSLVAVHFKGGGPGLIAAMSGEVSATFTNIAETASFVRANKLRGIAVTSLKRSPALPKMPTVDESGLPGYEFVTWFCLLAPAKTPRAVVTQLNEAMKKTLATPEQTRLFADRGLDIVAGTSEAAGDHLKKEVERWSRVVKERGMRAE